MADRNLARIQTSSRPQSRGSIFQTQSICCNSLPGAAQLKGNYQLFQPSQGFFFVFFFKKKAERKTDIGLQTQKATLPQLPAHDPKNGRGPRAGAGAGIGADSNDGGDGGGGALVAQAPLAAPKGVKEPPLGGMYSRDTPAERKSSMYDTCTTYVWPWARKIEPVAACARAHTHMYTYRR